LLLVMLAAGILLYITHRKKTSSPSKIPAGERPESKGELLINGIVLDYGSNAEGDLDKIYVLSDKKKTILHFPPHTAQRITTAAPVRELIEAKIEQRAPDPHHPDSIFELKYLRGFKSKKELDLSAIPAPFPRKGVDVQIRAYPPWNFSLDNGREKTLVLSDKRILLPPHMAHELFPIISQAKVILVKGYMRDSAEGFVTASGKNVLKPNTIQIDSITYKIR